MRREGVQHIGKGDIFSWWGFIVFMFKIGFKLESFKFGIIFKATEHNISVS